MEFKIIEASKEDAEELSSKIDVFNNSCLKVENNKKAIKLENYCVKKDESVIAGVSAVIYHSCLFVDVLFVDELYRGMNLGTKLLKEVEDKAKMQGVKLAHLDTFDFQAKDFYIKNGYKIFGILENSPKQGNIRYYFKKDL